MKYKRESLEEIFDSVKEIQFFSEQIETKIKTDYFSDIDYDFSVELRKINENWQKIKKYLPSDGVDQKVSWEEANQSIIATMKLLKKEKR